MARGRFLSKSLSTSRKFEQARVRGGVLGEFCQVLFPLLNSHADDFGRLPGDAFTVKMVVLPTSPRSEEEFDHALSVLTNVGLIRRAEVGEQPVIQIVAFEDHQVGLSKRTKSKYPEIPKDLPLFREFPRTSVKFTGIPSEVEEEVEGEVEGKKERTPAPPESPCGNSVDNSEDVVGDWTSAQELAPFAVVCALVRSVLNEASSGKLKIHLRTNEGEDGAAVYDANGLEADLIDIIKERCAKARLGYNTELVRKALDAVRRGGKRG